ISHKARYTPSKLFNTLRPVFFATPHHGFPLATPLSHLRTLTSLLAWRRPNPPLHRALRPDSETLANIADAFLPLTKHLRIFYFWAQLPSDMGRVLGRRVVVPLASAAPVVEGTERAGIAGTHEGMVRFGTLGMQGFRIVVDALER
ncbi:hypothetical protein C8A05DRAFT_36817, partial [Staphylotrichum tortipilum]